VGPVWPLWQAHGPTHKEPGNAGMSCKRRMSARGAAGVKGGRGGSVRAWERGPGGGGGGGWAPRPLPGVGGGREE
jgi:hypothetical protein